MDVRSAELTKYAANAMLATKISFMNEMANIAERVGADIELVRQGIGSDPRIGYHFIYPGAGYGGSCFPKDVQALERTARASRLRGQAAGRGRSGQRPAEEQAVRADQPPLRRQTGRPDRRALGPGVQTEHRRHARGAQPPSDGAFVGGRRPGSRLRPRSERRDRTHLWRTRRPGAVRQREAALQGADALAVVTEWKAFRSPDFHRIRATLAEPALFDGRNLYDPVAVEEAGLAYYGIGRGRSLHDWT